MNARESTSLSNQINVAIKVSNWNLDDIDRLKSSADNIRSKFGEEELMTPDMYSHLRTLLRRLIIDFTAVSNDELSESELVEACDTVQIISDFLREKTVKRDLKNPLSLVYLIASWAYSTKCDEIRKIANGVISDLGNPLEGNVI